MKLSLRLAHKLVRDLESKKSVYRQTKKVIGNGTSHSEIKKIWTNAWDANTDSIEMQLKLIDVIFELRAAIAEKNNTTFDGECVNTLVQKKTIIEAKMKELSEFAEKTNSPDDESRINESIATTRHSEHGYNQNAYTSGVSNEMFKEFNIMYVTLKREQQQVTDKLAVVNNKFNIEISEETQRFCEELQVL